jgi:hypothetical protein
MQYHRYRSSVYRTRYDANDDVCLDLQNGRSSLYTVFVILTIVYAYYFNSSIMLFHTYVVYAYEI